jgi:Bardet-Biedl syndrome 4 protein
MQSTLERRSDLIAGSLSTNRLKRNWLIHQLYVRNEKKDCLAVIDQQLRDTNGNCEYPMYVKALIRRKEGKIQEVSVLFRFSC